MTIQVDRLLAHLVPGPERVIGKDGQMTIENELGVVRDTRPAPGVGRRCGIIVAGDQVLSPVQLRRQLVAVAAPRRHEVAQVPDFLLLANECILVPDQGDVVCRYIRKRTAVYAQDTRIGEMGIAGEINYSADVDHSDTKRRTVP
ncbi:hypothetical protein KX729_28710 [Rhizobium sp. XQZ8]|uniref:hypothetical protein n=1 Tax=Rhizobium populisoli TaxID=2859785 RepID=UPI001CA5EEEE|nr:hypothetical protein [Rhizobium populisoli]